MSANYPERINALWTVFLLGTLFHTDLGLMPLFHGQSVALSDAHGNANVSGILWLMLVFFTFPMLAIVATTFTHSKRYRTIHFGLTVLYSVLNFLHVVLDLMVKPIVWYQIALMVFLFGVGLLLNWVSWQWLKVRRSSSTVVLG
ncbi:MAG: hypothetical protein HC852_23630 [Acaryochloridaceae cyanobacterium RU_4_10]|nr:hypothetical protein [Acaryochloridaceae cyanobacterium RU_4_10]